MKFAYETNARERVEMRKARMERNEMTAKVEKAVSMKNTAQHALSILAEFLVVGSGFAICWFLACL